MPDALIQNKVDKSGLTTIDLSQWLRSEDVLVIDLKDFLHQGLVIKEKDYRKAIRELDIEKFRGKIVGITCSTQAIIPHWAYMLISSSLHGVASRVVVGSPEVIKDLWIRESIQKIKPEEFKDKRVILKGCANPDVNAAAFAYATFHLQGHVKSLMYGEPCSTVPVYKKKKNTAPHE